MLLLTCEHASNRIPLALRSIFRKKELILNSHQGWDIGALSYARFLSSFLTCPLFVGKVCRLVVDTNRSLHHRALFSEYTMSLSAAQKRKLIHQYWLPFRQQVFLAIEDALLVDRTVFHVSCHSFTPVYKGISRSCDIGILYDPQRPLEKKVAHSLFEKLSQETAYRVRMNYPYKGTSDGHVTALRRVFPASQYLGIELEVNQTVLQTNYWKYVGLPALARAIQI